MAELDIAGNDYVSYAELDYADEYLAGDLLRADDWLARPEVTRKRALVSATRLLMRLQWRAGPPSLEETPQVVQDATCLLAADIAKKPAQGDSAQTGSNVKAVGAGSARVEFFRPTEGQVLPQAAFGLLRDLLGQDDALLGGVGEASAFGSCAGQRSRFDDFGIVGGDGETRYDERTRW